LHPLSARQSNPYVERLNIGMGPRTLAIIAAIMLEALLLFLLFSFKTETPPKVKADSIRAISLSDNSPPNSPEPSAEPPQQSPRPDPQTPPTPPTPQSTAAAQPLPPQLIKPIVTTPAEASTPAPPAPPQAVIRPATGQVYGPPNRGSSSGFRDTQRVGTAPNGEPMYAAAWYREPTHGELRGYLSTASGPGWGLIACRTAPDYRVEDCVALEEYPQGSQINRAVLAAAWQFRVRPPRLGGKVMVGSWVRIRIDYGVERR
jgi:protein TonB